jgi:catechol 2,3-dioxygenase-like lactoylglutathione lyase family enzyme
MRHHVELYVSDLQRSAAFWTPFMKWLGYDEGRWSGGINDAKDGQAHFRFLPAPSAHLAAGYHRQRVGLNHLAFQGDSREHVDRIAAWGRASSCTLLYESDHP